MHEATMGAPGGTPHKLGLGWRQGPRIRFELSLESTRRKNPESAGRRANPKFVLDVDYHHFWISLLDPRSSQARVPFDHPTRNHATLYAKLPA